MTLREKLDNYFEENGIQRKWFAKKIGMSPSLFFRVTSAHAKMPTKYWNQVIEATNGQITLFDLMEDKYGDDENLVITPSRSQNQCIISLK